MHPPELREQARDLRRAAFVISDIAEKLDVPRGTAYSWVRDLPRPARSSWKPRCDAGPNLLARRKMAEIAACEQWAQERMADMSEDGFFAAGIALYAGEGHKRDGCVAFTNLDPTMIRFFLSWLRRFFEVDESRLRACLYLHEDLDLDRAVAHWALLTGIPPSRFSKPYRAVADETRRHGRHVNGCLTVRYSCSLTHRKVMGLCRALLSSALADPA